MAIDAKHPLPAPQRERLDLVRTAAGRLLALVEDMLELGRAEHDRPALRLKTLALHPAVKTATDFLALSAASRGIDIQVDLPPELQVTADERSLEQVLLNLLSNAVKYNRSGQPVVVCAGVQPPFVELRIVDRGIGLTPEQQAQLFQPFNRLGAQHGPVSGTGLGLVISKALAEAMGGALSLSSRAGEGTTATLKLRLA
jgi:signal transduction histidine kinase